MHNDEVVENTQHWSVNTYIFKLHKKITRRKSLTCQEIIVAHN